MLYHAAGQRSKALDNPTVEAKDPSCGPWEERGKYMSQLKRTANICVRVWACGRARVCVKWVVSPISLAVCSMVQFRHKYHAGT